MRPPVFFHLRAVLGLCIRPSSIPGAGRGLLPSAVVPYEGEVISWGEVERRYGPDAPAVYVFRSFFGSVYRLGLPQGGRGIR